MRPSLLAFATCAALMAMAPAPLRAEHEGTAHPKLPNAGESVKVGLPGKNEGPSLLWKPRWRKFSHAEYAVTGTAIAITIGSLFIPPRPSAWNTGGILFDEGVRGALKPRSEGWRLNLRDTSDVLLSVATTYPFLIDALAVAWWHRSSPTVATQMALMNAEAMAITAALQGLVSSLVSRERPYAASGQNCPEGTETEDCVRSNRYRSFFSGHTSQAFVSAALTCAHHGNLPLYGDRASDTLACVSFIALAGTIGTFRIAGDMHYASDVITGAVLGSLVGLSVPYLLHYQSSSDETAKTKSAWPTVTLLPTPNGLALTGSF